MTQIPVTKDKDRLQLMEELNWKPANVFWKDKHDKVVRDLEIARAAASDNYDKWFAEHQKTRELEKQIADLQSQVQNSGPRDNFAQNEYLTATQFQE